MARNIEDKPVSERPEVEGARATDPQFPAMIDYPDLQMSTRAGLARKCPSTIVVSLDELLTRICVRFKVDCEEQTRLEMSPEAAAALGEQLLYARDKLTGRR